MPLVRAGAGKGLVGLESWLAFSTIPEGSLAVSLVANKISDFWVLELKVIPVGISAGIISLQCHGR